MRGGAKAPWGFSTRSSRDHRPELAGITTFPITPAERELLAEMPIVVGEPVLEPIPVMGRTGYVILALGLLLAGLYACRRQEREQRDWSRSTR